MYEKNESLINTLRKDGYLITSLYIDAFKKNKRADFVTEDIKDCAYGNYPLQIGFKQTISQPATVAFMLEKLAPKPGNKILEIGTGSGWQAALLSYIVGSTGRVITIEIIKELAGFAKQNLINYHYEWTEVVEGDGSKGYIKEAPYDRIIVAAAPKECVPEEYLNQLKIGGKLIMPLGGERQSLILIERISENDYRQEEFLGFIFVPLIEN